ncbi:bifunctional 3'-5' exonuclease/DNA polymerase [Herbiconiux liukaitaii]|uniref:bifunctional 3'-5' exonuclease/DNA polymerase n=1 Tax=Herbiconiux liukaitaii TaxID=3342799 RepID=UPI0035B89812
MSGFVVVSDAPGGGIRLTRLDDAADPIPLDPTRAARDGGVVVGPGELGAVAARLEAGRPRWVWDDTARWYPQLLDAGVRVERCVDLRLSHAILRTSSLTAGTAYAKAPASPWDSLRPAVNLGSGAAQEGRSDAGRPVDPLRTAPTHTTLFDDILPTADRRGPARRHPDPAAARGGASGSGDPGGPGDPGDPGATPEVHELRAQRTAVAEAAAADPAAGRIALLLAAESAGALAAAEMRHVGLPWSAARHDAVLTDLLGPRPARPDERPARLAELLELIRAALDDPTANPDSPAELLKSLRRAGIAVSSTRSWELQNIRHPVIEPLLDYKKRARLLTANGWNWLDTWVRDGRFHPTYLPGGVVTGRWASEGGGALQLPKLVRSAVVADAGRVLVVADAAQLEPRILAALAGDRAMAAAGRGRDLYDGIVASGAVDTRAHAKVAMLGAMYGATTGESGRMLPRLARAYPAAIAFVEDAARAGEAGATVSTRLGRTSPLPGDDWLDLRDEAAAADGADEQLRARARSSSRSWGRFTRNFVVQGTAAEWALCWIGSIRRRLWSLDAADGAAHDAALGAADGAAARTPTIDQRPHLSFFLHDELMVHTPAHLAEQVAHELREAAAEAGRLIFGDAPVDFPVTVAIVDRYDQAK